MIDESTYQKQQAEQLAKDILNLSRNVLLVNLRFLDAALCKFVQTPVKITDTIATDGQNLYYNTRHVLTLYRQGREVPVRDYLHTTLHCIFHHPFIHTLVDMDLWDLSCDIAVENVINELALPDTQTTRAAAQTALAAYFDGSLLGRPVYRARLGKLFYDTGKIRNYEITAPSSDVAGDEQTLPRLGTVTLTEGT